MRTLTLAALSLVASVSIASGASPVIRGVVTSKDDSSKIADAKVTLVAGAGWLKQAYAELNPEQPQVTSASDADGNFSLPFPQTDRRFFLPDKHHLVVTAPGFQPHVVDLHYQRIKVNVPLEIKLRRGEGSTVAIVSPENKTLAGVRVAPAIVAGHRIPWCVARSLANVSDENGKVTVQGCDAETLEAVFLSGDGVGNQRSGVRKQAGKGIVVVPARTREVVGKVIPADGETIDNLDATRLFVISRPVGASARVTNPDNLGWSFAHLDAAGNFRSPALSQGQLQHLLACPSDFPFRFDADKQVELSGGEGAFAWEMEMSKQVQLIATIREAGTDTPLEDISIASFDGRLEDTFTDASGKARFFRVRDHVSYYPHDHTGVLYFDDTFYQSSKKLPVDGVLELEPLTLNRSTGWRGSVVDADGKPVAGASIAYEFGQERFLTTQHVFSNPEGEFSLFGVADQTSVTLLASKGNSLSEKRSVILNSDEPVELVITPRKTAVPTGRVVDLDGHPVVGISVNIRRGQVMIAEGYSSEELMESEFYDRPTTATTNDDGLFEFPKTVDFKERVQIRISAPDFFKLHSPYAAGKLIGDEAEVSSVGRLELGEFRIMRRGAESEIQVVVKSEAGEGIANARVAIVGARVGTVRGTTGANGTASFRVPKGKAIVGISAPGYAPYFAPLANDGAVDCRLSKQTSPITNSIRNVEPETFFDAANQVFGVVEPVVVKSSPMHRVGLYMQGLAATQPEQFLAYVQTAVVQNPQVGQYALMYGEHALRQQPEMVELVVNNPLVPAEYAAMLLTQAASMSDDPDLHEDFLGEALAMARKKTGRDGLIGKARLARTLLAAGHNDLATQIAEEIWQDADEFQSMVDSNQRKLMVGESRVVVPVLAILDLKRAQQLIRLTAREVELDRLLSECELTWGQANAKAWIQHLEKGNVDAIDGGGIASWLRYQNEAGTMWKQGLGEPGIVGPLISDLNTRIGFLLAHARLSSNEEERQSLIEQTVQAMSSINRLESDHYLFHYTGVVLPALQQFDSLAPELLDALIFESLWQLPESFESDRLHTILGGAARIVSFRDRELGRQLLEPAFEDTGWLFGGRQLRLNNNQSILSIASVDPMWCVDVVNKLCDGPLAQDEAAQLEVRAGVAAELVKEAMRQKQ